MATLKERKARDEQQKPLGPNQPNSGLGGQRQHPVSQRALSMDKNNILRPQGMVQQAGSSSKTVSEKSVEAPKNKNANLKQQKMFYIQKGQN